MTDFKDSTRSAAEDPRKDPETTETIPSADASEEIMLAFLVEKLKGSHHHTQFILSRAKTREEWCETMDRMIDEYGANMTMAERDRLIDWLIAR
jgi:hypothetical protein